MAAVLALRGCFGSENGASVILIEKHLSSAVTPLSLAARNAVVPKRQATMPMNDALMADLVAFQMRTQQNTATLAQPSYSAGQIREYLESSNTDTF